MASDIRSMAEWTDDERMEATRAQDNISASEKVMGAKVLEFEAALLVGFESLVDEKRHMVLDAVETWLDHKAAWYRRVQELTYGKAGPP